jgi:signal transduction histidine kinase
VPVSERETVFQSFVRYDTGGRSGLGLAIAKTFVEAHGEGIWVEDVSGGGARFVFTLPGAMTWDSHAGDQKTSLAASPSDATGPNGAGRLGGRTVRS